MPKISKTALKKLKKAELLDLLAGLLEDDEDDVSTDDSDPNDVGEEVDGMLHGDNHTPVASDPVERELSERERMQQENQRVIRDKKIPGNQNPGRIESIQIGPRPNLFFEERRHRQFINDPEVKKAEKYDKILPPVAPAPRDRDSEYVTVQCGVCQREYRAHANTLSRESLMKCNNCSGAS